MDEEEQLGATVTVRGQALDRHEGAIVVREGRRSIFVDGLLRWPQAVYGREVEVTGVLTTRSAGSASLVDDEGRILHGAAGEGDFLLLEDARWTVVPVDGEAGGQPGGS